MGGAILFKPYVQTDPSLLRVRYDIKGTLSSNAQQTPISRSLSLVFAFSRVEINLTTTINYADAGTSTRMRD